MDMLVRLDNLPELAPEISRLAAAGVTVRRIAAYEASVLSRFVSAHFQQAWVDESQRCFVHSPPTCFVAIADGQIVGFAAYEVTRRNFFGPTGVSDAHRGRGIGRALLLASLHAMRELDYKYAIIGWVGPADFYQRCVGATLIPGSEYSKLGPDWLLPRGNTQL